MPPKPPLPHEKKGPGPHPPPKPPHGPGKPGGPPHKGEKTHFIISIIVSTIVAAVFYYILHSSAIQAEASIPGSVALWVGLVTIIYKLMERHP